MISCPLVIFSNILWQKCFDIFQIISKINSFLPSGGGQPHLDHMVKKLLQALIISIQVIQNTGGIKVL